MILYIGPKLYIVLTFFSSNISRLQAEDYNSVRMELLRNMFHQSIGLDRVLFDSGQHCVDLNPIKNYTSGKGPNFLQ